MSTYHVIKRCVPQSVRTMLRPYYLWFGTRKFTKPTVMSVKEQKVVFDIVADPTNGAVDSYIFMHKHWETHVATEVQKYLDVSGVFVDVGANIGYFSLLAGKVVGPQGRVIAFEPIPKLQNQLQESVRLNVLENIEVRTCALGSEVQSLQLGLHHNNIGGSSVEATTADEYITVLMSTLDKELLTSVSRVDVIKIDVEGYEQAVLLGGREMLRQFRPVIILEFSPAAYVLKDANMAFAILELIENLDYRFSVLQWGQEDLTAQEVMSVIGDKQVDLLCVPVR